MSAPLLRVEGLTTVFRVEGHDVPALSGIDLSCDAGERIGVVGESGSGKSLLAMSLLNLVRSPGRIAGGCVLFKGEDLLSAPRRHLRRLRGGALSLIFQDAGGSLTPVYPIGTQIVELIVKHLRVDRRQARERAISLLRDVGIPEPERRMSALPSQLSGGMKQRVAIAMALCTEPSVLIADDPTSAVDVTIQAQILKLLFRLVSERNLALIFISHDFRVVSTICERLLIIYGGSIVEEGRSADVFRSPRHPYTRALLACSPSVEAYRFPFATLPGSPPSLRDRVAPGCPFVARCDRQAERCRSDRPRLLADPDGRRFACWNPILDQTAAQPVARGAM